MPLHRRRELVKTNGRCQKSTVSGTLFSLALRRSTLAQHPSMSRYLTLLLFIILPLLGAKEETSDDAFTGSPYQYGSLRIADLSKPEGDPARQVEIALSNAYYIQLPFSQRLPPRFEIELSLIALTDQQLADPPMISLYLPATYELTWENKPLGRNGKLDENMGEISVGNSYRSFPLPAPLRQGETSTLRITGTHTFQKGTGHHMILTLQTISERLADARKSILTYCLYLAFALFGAYLVAYSFYDKERRQYLLLGLSCIAFGLFAVNKLLYFQLNVPYPYLDWIGFGTTFVHTCLSLLAPASLITLLRFQGRYWFALCMAPYLVSKLGVGLDLITSTAYVCLALSFAAILLKRIHAIKAFAVSLVLVLNNQVPYFQQNPAIGLGVLATFLFVSIINLQRIESRERSKVQLQNARLQLELLKSKIEPHFVLNSLTSAIEWIETNPKQGVKLIQALAREFEILSDISDKPLIPLTVEIESCRSYLEIMGYRKKASYVIECVGISREDTIPPAVIRNLVENAISHNSYGQRTISFQLTQTTVGQKRTIVFSAPLTEAAVRADPIKEGTGIRYLKARLSESYRAWEFTHEPKDGNWETVITLA